MPEAASQTAPQAAEQEEGQQAGITPQMVRQVADKVYAMWLRDMKIEKERERPLARRWPRHG